MRAENKRILENQIEILHALRCLDVGENKFKGMGEAIRKTELLLHIDRETT